MMVDLIEFGCLINDTWSNKGFEPSSEAISGYVLMKFKLSFLLDINFDKHIIFKS